MGKRKKKGSSLSQILTLASAVLGLVAFFMMFAPAATTEVLGQKITYSGANLAFGYTEKGSLVSVEVFRASADIITYLLVLVGIVFAVLALLGKFGKIAPWIAAAAFLVAGILFFCSIALSSPATSLSGDAAASAVKKVKESLSLGAGAIVGGILSLLAALGAAAGVFLAKK